MASDSPGLGDKPTRRESIAAYLPFGKRKSDPLAQACRSAEGIVFSTNPDDYDLLGVIGNDSRDWPTVTLARYKPTNTEVAIKRQDLEKDPTAWTTAPIELIMSRSMRHPNLLRPLACFLAGSELWTVMPYMQGGSAWRVMQYGARPGLSEAAIAYVLGCVLRALVYLHDRGVVHNAIKASNIVIDADGCVQLCHMRDCLNMMADGVRIHAVHKYSGTAASIPWFAPEILDQDLYGYDQKADIYSIGIAMLELANNHAPYSNLPPTKVLLLKMHGAITMEDFLGPYPRRMSKQMRQVINLCLHRDPRKRPSAAKLLKHTFFKDALHKPHRIAEIVRHIPPLTEHLPSRSQYLVHQIISQTASGGEIELGAAERCHSVSEGAVVEGPAIDCPDWIL